MPNVEMPAVLDRIRTEIDREREIPRTVVSDRPDSLQHNDGNHSDYADHLDHGDNHPAYPATTSSVGRPAPESSPWHTDYMDHNDVTAGIPGHLKGS